MNRLIEVVPKLFPDILWFLSVPEGSTGVFVAQRQWNKRDKSTHRYVVADVNGKVDLTVPVEKPESFSKAVLGDIRLSDHGQWWHVHRVTLESGYGRTPFFEHYFPLMAEFFDSDTTRRYPRLVDYLTATANCVARLLELNLHFKVIDNQQVLLSAESEEKNYAMPQYWQVREQKLGFIPSLSVLDLLFNLGPEAQLYIRKLRME